MKERLAYVGWVGFCLFVGCSLIVNPDTSELGRPVRVDADADAQVDAEVDAGPIEDADSGLDDADTGPTDAEAGPGDGDADAPVCLPACNDNKVCTTDECVCNAVSCTCQYTAVDADQDGYPAASVSGTPCVGGTDCDDNNPNVHPGATEICSNGIDEDCSGADQLCGDYCSAQPIPIITLTADNSTTPPSYSAVVGAAEATFTDYEDNFGFAALLNICASEPVSLNGPRDRIYTFTVTSPQSPTHKRFNVTIENTSTSNEVRFGVANESTCSDSNWSVLGTCRAVAKQASTTFGPLNFPNNGNGDATIFLLVRLDRLVESTTFNISVTIP